MESRTAKARNTLRLHLSPLSKANSSCPSVNKKRSHHQWSLFTRYPQVSSDACCPDERWKGQLLISNVLQNSTPVRKVPPCLPNNQTAGGARERWWQPGAHPSRQNKKTGHRSSVLFFFSSLQHTPIGAGPACFGKDGDMGRDMRPTNKRQLPMHLDKVGMEIAPSWCPWWKKYNVASCTLRVLRAE